VCQLFPSRDRFESSALLKVSGDPPTGAAAASQGHAHVPASLPQHFLPDLGTSVRARIGGLDDRRAPSSQRPPHGPRDHGGEGQAKGVHPPGPLLHVPPRPLRAQVASDGAADGPGSLACRRARPRTRPRGTSPRLRARRGLAWRAPAGRSVAFRAAPRSTLHVPSRRALPGLARQGKARRSRPWLAAIRTSWLGTRTASGEFTPSPPPAGDRTGRGARVCLPNETRARSRPGIARAGASPGPPVEGQNSPRQPGAPAKGCVLARGRGC
jgi:hypothetical protein